MGPARNHRAPRPYDASGDPRRRDTGGLRDRLTGMVGAALSTTDDHTYTHSMSPLSGGVSGRTAASASALAFSCCAANQASNSSCVTPSLSSK